MRLRTLLTAAITLSLYLPACSAAAAAPALNGARTARTAVAPPDLNVERALLQDLMVRRRGLIAAIISPDRSRGRLLTRTMLAAADAVLSADAAALLHDIRQAAPAQAPRAAHGAGRAISLPQLTSAAPGTLWSPLAPALAPGPLAWALSAAGTTQPASRDALAMPLATSLSALTSWAALLPAASASRGLSARRWFGPPLPAALAAAGGGVAVPLNDPAFSAPAHAALTVQGSSGPVPIAAVNPMVAAALLVPDGTSRHLRHAVLAARAVRALKAPDQATLVRRRQAVLAALAQVRALEAWSRANAPAPLLSVDDVIPSTAALYPRLDRWSSTLVLSDTSPPGFDATMPSPGDLPGHSPDIPATAQPAGQAGNASALPGSDPFAAAVAPAAALPDALGATVALSSTTDATGSVPSAGIVLSGTLATRGTGSVALSAISDTAPTDRAPSAVDALITVAPSATAPATATAAPRLVLRPVGGPLASSTGLMRRLVVVAATAPASGDSGNTPQPGEQKSATPSSGGQDSATLPSSGQGSATSSSAAPATDTVSGTAPLTPAIPILASPPPTVPATLDMALDGTTPALTVTAQISATSALTLLVTLPITTAQSLVPAGYRGARAALESVLRRGQALFAHLNAVQAPLMQAYRAQLNAVVTRNAAIEQHWLALWDAHVRYRTALQAYRQRVQAYNAYAHALHLAQLLHAEWQRRTDAWTRYTRQMAAYKLAVALHQVPAVPISGTVPLTASGPPTPVPLPPKPVMPPLPGPEPVFTQTPPAWPGSLPVFIPNPGPEPSGYPLPVPPAAIPPWDGASQLISVISYAAGAFGVGAAGTEETTQAALLAGGALDGVGSYQDPIKGPITTYWGGQTIFQSFHPGIDIAAPMYTPVRAAAAGIVTWAGYAVAGQRHASYGLCVIIRHNAHFSTLYAHMDDLTYGLQVRVGDIVQQGQVIGHVGLTGWTTGPHLHFEMRENNVQFNPLLLIPNPQD